MKAFDFAKVEARVLASLPLTQKTLLSEAQRQINGAKTKEERTEAKRRMYLFLYGNPEPLKQSMTLEVKNAS